MIAQAVFPSGLFSSQAMAEGEKSERRERGRERMGEKAGRRA